MICILFKNTENDNDDISKLSEWCLQTNLRSMPRGWSDQHSTKFRKQRVSATED